MSPRNHEVCDKIAINLLTCSIRVNLLVLLSYTLAAGAPLYNTLYTDKKEMIIPVLLPFIDPDTPNGFAVNYAYQMITCIFGSFIVPGIELLTCVLRNNVSVTAAVIENAIREFRIRLRRERKFCPDLAWEFRNILFKILDFDGFVFQQNKLCEYFFNKYSQFLQTCDVFNWCTLLETLSAAIIPGVCNNCFHFSVSHGKFLFTNYCNVSHSWKNSDLIEQIKWTTGLGFSACCYIQLVVLCDMGKAVNDAVMMTVHRFKMWTTLKCFL